MNRGALLVARVGPVLLFATVLTGSGRVSVAAENWQPNFESLGRHSAPDWLLDAKIGLQFVGPPMHFDDEQCYHWTRAAQRARQLGHTESDQALRAHIDEFKVVGGIPYVWDVREPSDLDALMEAYKQTGAKFLVSMLQGAYPGTEGLRMTKEEVGAARRHGLKVGLHYNLLRRERTPSIGDPGYVPWYQNRIQSEVESIGADFLFFDGCQAPSAYFRTPELIAWFFNWADANGKEVWTNEDLGIECREKLQYGDVLEGEGYTMSGISPKPWINWDTLRNEWNCWVNEFGIHKRDGVRWQWKYRPPEELLQVFVYNVSVGGVWCVQMVNTENAWKTMREIGDWLAVNGDAIYGTRPLGDPDPDCRRLPEGWPPPGDRGAGVWWWRYQQTVKVAREHGPFYYTTKGDTVYAIHWGWPGEELAIPNIKVKPGGTVRMLGVETPLEWQEQDGHLVVRMPAVQPCRHAFSIAIPADQRACLSGAQESDR